MAVRNRLVRIIVGLGCVAVATLGLRLVDADGIVWALASIVAVTLAALLGPGAAAAACAAATASFSYHVTPPVGSLSIGTGDDAAALVAFVVVSGVVSSLLVQVRAADQAAAAARIREERVAAEAQLSDSRAAFFAAAGHNLRTPLAALKASAEAVVAAGPDLAEADRSELLGGLVVEADRLERLVGRVLQLARATIGTDVLRLEAAVDVDELVREAVARVDRADPGPDRSWRIEVEPLPGAVLVDPVAIEEVVLVLAENAHRCAPPATEIEVRGTRVPGGYDLSVVDHGPGIPDQERAQVVEPFRSDRHGASGSGLGLAIARGLATAHGGVLRIDDTPGGGATVTVHIPEATP